MYTRPLKNESKKAGRVYWQKSALFTDWSNASWMRLDRVPHKYSNVVTTRV